MMILEAQKYQKIPKNFIEAIKYLEFCIKYENENSRLKNISKKQDFITDLLKAYNEFIKLYKRRPLSFEFPDITCSTGNYTELKKIYQDKMKEDRELFDMLHNCTTIEKYLVDSYYPYLHTYQVISTPNIDYIEDEILFKGTDYFNWIYGIFKHIKDFSVHDLKEIKNNILKLFASMNPDCIKEFEKYLNEM
ncbi:hypothetical protein HZS_3204 [Henneguya salminicola]|nr:hypothetical protein HZS_3204 [Henneguya salminicola]